jgi:multiple sugar transport system permease protein
MMTPSSTLVRLLRFGFLAVGAAIILFPYVFMISASLKPPEDVFSASLSLWPEHFSAYENYSKALTRIPMVRILLNGALVCTAIVVFQILFALPAAYALAKLRFPGRGVLFGLVMLGLLVPIHAISIPLYAAAQISGLLNTLAVLVIPFTLSVFAMFLFRQFIKAMPDELIHAARMDGLSEAAIVWRIILPNAWPAASAFAIFSVVASCRLHRIDPVAYLDEVLRVLPYWPRERYIELSPLRWTTTRARLDSAELDKPLGKITVPEPPSAG